MEQDRAISQIAGALEKMDKVTRSNSDNAQKTAESANEMNSQILNTRHSFVVNPMKNSQIQPQAD